MSDHPTSDELRQLKDRFIRAFHAWLVVPSQILESGVQADITPRKQMCAFLERNWHKLRQDINGTLCLIGTNHIGSAAALSRVCRETAIRMVVWSFSDPALDQAHLHVAKDIRPRTNAERLLRDARALLALCGDSLLKIASSLLEEAIETAQGIRDAPDVVACGDETSAVKGMGFAALTRGAVERMIANDLDPSILARQLVDYWLECEAVHTGEGAIYLYEPLDYGQELQINGEITCLVRLNDLYPLKALVTAALVNAVELKGKLPKPKESKDLEVVASIAEQVVVSFASNAGGSETDHSS